MLCERFGTLHGRFAPKSQSFGAAFGFRKRSLVQFVRECCRLGGSRPSPPSIPRGHRRHRLGGLGVELGMLEHRDLGDAGKGAGLRRLVRSPFCLGSSSWAK